MAKNEKKVSKNADHTFLLLTSIVAIVAIVAIIVLVSGNKTAPQPNTQTYGVPVQVQTAGEIEESLNIEGELFIDEKTEEQNLAGEAYSSGSISLGSIKTLQAGFRLDRQ